jgi:hypothetical protein
LIKCVPINQPFSYFSRIHKAAFEIPSDPLITKAVIDGRHKGCLVNEDFTVVLTVGHIDPLLSMTG